MNRKMKLTALIMVISMITLITGCSGGNELFSAFSKQNSIKTMETATDLKIAFDISGLPASEQNNPEFQKVLKALDNLNLKVKGKTIQNEDKTLAQNLFDISLDLDGTSISTKMWSNIDFTGDTPIQKQIFKIPEILSASLPTEYANKDYLVNDTWKTSNSSISTEAIRKITAITKNFQSTMRDFIKAFVANSNLGFDIVQSKGTKVIDGQTVSVYQIKLDNESLRGLVKYTVNGLLDNKIFVDMLKNYITEIVQSQMSNSAYGNDAASQLSKLMMGFDSTFSIIKMFINKMLDAFEDVDFLGDKGIVIDYAINKDGYIVNESGTVDLNFDINALINALTKLDPIKFKGEQIAEKLVIKMCFEFNTNTTNINQDMTIKFPEVNEKNSINIADLQKSRTNINSDSKSKLID